MTNINSITKNRQLLIMAGVLTAIGMLCLGLLWMSENKNQDAEAAAQAQAAKPNLTGVVTSSFTDQVQASSLQQQQASTNELERKLEKALAAIDQQTALQEAQNRNIEDLKSTNLRLSEELEKLKKDKPASLPEPNVAADPIPNAMKNSVAEIGRAHV